MVNTKDSVVMIYI